MSGSQLNPINRWLTLRRSTIRIADPRLSDNAMTVNLKHLPTSLSRRHLPGFDHERLTYRYSGRDFRLTDMHGGVVRELLA